MLDTTTPIPPKENARPVVSYQNVKGNLSGKGALFGGVVGFGYGIVKGKSKILWTIVGAVLGSAIETVIKSINK
jgi:outer membrane lipoprotein SlyB